MKPQLETERLVATLKQLMKKQGYRYQDLAAALKLSLPTVKRVLSGADISLERLLAICGWLGISLSDLVEMSKSSEAELFRFTEDQEKFFSSNPSYLAYLYSLYSGKLSPSEIQRKYNLSPVSTRKYLRQLEKLGLIELLTPDRVRVLIRGVITWDDRGVLGRTFSTRMIRQLCERAISSDSKHLHTILMGWTLTEENYQEMKKEFSDLAAKYRQVSKLNSKLKNREQMIFISFVAIADAWDDEIFRTIVNVD
jgi:transcriptional regulator with XRE-family HTH domain